VNLITKPPAAAYGALWALGDVAADCLDQTDHLALGQHLVGGRPITQSAAASIVTNPEFRIPFVFGVYPGGAAGDETGHITTGPPDVAERFIDALGFLQGQVDKPFVVRAYRVVADDAIDSPAENPVGVARYLGGGRTLDLCPVPVAQRRHRRLLRFVARAHHPLRGPAQHPAGGRPLSSEADRVW